MTFLSRTATTSRLLLAGISLIACIAAFAGTASASPSSLNIAIVDSYAYSDTGTGLAAAVAAVPGVGHVDLIDSLAISSGGAGTTPTLDQLKQYDAVIAANDYAWADPATLGSVLADYVDQGGVVVAPNWTAWDPAEDAGYGLLGRWQTGGYSPFNITQNGSDTTEALGSYDSSHPFFAGLSAPLDNDDVYDATSVAPSAILLASWSSGAPAVAVKGQVVSYNGWFGDGASSNDSDMALFAVNAIKALGYHPLSVARIGSGSVSSSAGILTCATTCDGNFLAGKSMTLSATPAAGSAFTGWAGACSGNAACSYTTGYPGITSVLWNNLPVTAKFASTKLKYGKYRKGKLSVSFPGAGKLTVKASGVKTIKKTLTKAGMVKLLIKPTGRLKKKLAKGKSVKVKFKFAYTPTGAASATNSSRSIKLKK